MKNYGIDNGARGSSKVSLICLPPTNAAGVSTRIARFSKTSQKRSLFVQRGLKGLNVNWNPFNFAHSEAFSTLLLNWISARLSWGRAFWVVWAQGRKIAREIAKPRFREIQMRIWELGEIEMGIANGPPRKWTNWNQIRVVCARYLRRNLVHLVPWFSPKRRFFSFSIKI